jgi:putative zinc finger/helix-turn-helix YgiT family protein
MEAPANLEGGTLIVPNAQWEECTHCGQIVLGYALVKAVERLSRQRQGLLLPEEIKTIRERAGLTQAEIAEFLSIGEKTYTRWEAGRSIQNKSSDNLIRLIDQNPDLLEHFEAQRNPDRQQVIRAYFTSLGTLKGQSQVKMAAHKAELDSATAASVRQRLRDAVAKSSAGK